MTVSKDLNVKPDEDFLKKEKTFSLRWWNFLVDKDIDNGTNHCNILISTHVGKDRYISSLTDEEILLIFRESTLEIKDFSFIESIYKMKKETNITAQEYVQMSGRPANTKEQEYERTIELFGKIYKEQGLYFAFALLYDSQYTNQDIRRMMELILSNKYKKQWNEFFVFYKIERRCQTFATDNFYWYLDKNYEKPQRTKDFLESDNNWESVVNRFLKETNESVFAFNALQNWLKLNYKAPILKEIKL